MSNPLTAKTALFYFATLPGGIFALVLALSLNFYFVGSLNPSVLLPGVFLILAFVFIVAPIVQIVAFRRGLLEQLGGRLIYTLVCGLVIAVLVMTQQLFNLGLAGFEGQAMASGWIGAFFSVIVEIVISTPVIIAYDFVFLRTAKALGVVAP